MHKLIHFNLFHGQFVSVYNSAAMLIRLLIGGQRDRCSIPSRCNNVSVLWSLQTGSGAHPVSNSMHIQGSFSGGRAAGAWSWPLTPFSATVKNHCTIFPLRFSLRGVVQGQIYLPSNSVGGVMGCAVDCALDILGGTGSFLCTAVSVPVLCFLQLRN
jgi:hypothetical protein